MKHIVSYFVLGCITLANSQLLAHPFEDPDQWKRNEIALALSHDKIIKKEPMGSFLEAQGKKTDFGGEVFLVHFENGMKGVFKPSKNDSKDELPAAHIEVAAYQTSIYLGFPFVPPTVLRTIDGETGSLQLFVSTAIDLLVPGAYKKMVNQLDPMDRIRLYLFYFIFGQFDNGPHNLLALQKNNKIYPIAIDNEGMANLQQVKKLDSLPFVAVAYSQKFHTHDWGDTFPFHKVKCIKKPHAKNLKAIFGDKLPDSFYKGFKSYGLPFHYVIFQNRLWRQFHAGNQGYLSLFINQYDQETLTAIRRLNLSELRKLFHMPKPSPFSNQYFNGILERRNMVLDFFAKK